MGKNLQTLIIGIIITLGSKSIYSQYAYYDCRLINDFSRTLLSKFKTYFKNVRYTLKILYTQITFIINQEKQQFCFITNI